MVAFIGITLFILCEITSVFAVYSNGKIKAFSILCSGALYREIGQCSILQRSAVNCSDLVF